MSGRGTTSGMPAGVVDLLEPARPEEFLGLRLSHCQHCREPFLTPSACPAAWCPTCREAHP